jgi:hypothetical protein
VENDEVRTKKLARIEMNVVSHHHHYQNPKQLNPTNIKNESLRSVRNL